MALLPALSQESYIRAYPQLAKLAMLKELQDVHALRCEQASGQAPPLTLGEVRRRLRWPERLAASQATLASQEPLLALRRQLAGLMGDKAGVAACWLQHAKLCRVTGHHEAAATATLEALAAGAPGARLERAKLLWHSGRERRALEELRTALSNTEEGHSSSQDPASTSLQAMQQARMLLQLAKWTAAQGQMGYSELKPLFEAAIAAEPGWEKVYYQYARYLDQLFQDAKQRQTGPGGGGGRDGRGGGSQGSQAINPGARLGGRVNPTLKFGEDRQFWEYLPEVLTSYGRCIETGYRHVLQCLPRMLTLYCEFGNEQTSRVTGGRGGGREERQSNKEKVAATQVINLMKGFARSIPPMAWMVTLPQLISRICHTHPDVSDVLQGLLLRSLDAFPQQTLWSIACLIRSANPLRRSMAAGLLQQARKASGSGFSELLRSFSTVSDQLIKLSMWQPPKGQHMAKQLSAKAEFASLITLLPTCGIMIPVQEAFAVPLPPTPLPPSKTPPSSSSDTLVTMTAMRDEVLVMSSLQRPKKVVFRGSDGKDYPFLAKPKDDLRKDYRLMDFAGVANNLFASTAAARRRGLRLRTYYVIVLTEDCGILQACCEEVYSAEGLYKRRDFSLAVKKVYDAWEADINNKNASRAGLLNKVLQGLPPRMHKWWLTHFPEPASWLQARLNFTRTNAVWCMTGHMLGLGDRHGENIMIDQVSGETVHVDFGCLFDRGLTLEVPEKVPFRLTQNVVDSFGVAGVEGAFRRSAETTLAVLRQHRSTLMTCAETFLYDPLVDWSKGSGSRAAAAAAAASSASGEPVAEQENPMAKDALATIDGRLAGTLLGVRSLPSLPLSVEGHAARLMAEAMDKDNLGSMYIWWMPWF
ncbi:kinase-like domain-containing protein [Haematococcus lacustris]